MTSQGVDKRDHSTLFSTSVGIKLGETDFIGRDKNEGKLIFVGFKKSPSSVY